MNTNTFLCVLMELMSIEYLIKMKLFISASSELLPLCQEVILLSQ